MATELDRLVVRLMGDATDFQKTLDKAIADSRAAVAELNRQKGEAAAQNQLLQDAARIIESIKTPTEQYASSVANLQGHLEAGRLTQEQYNRALGQAQTTFVATKRASNELAGTLRSVGMTATGVGAAITGVFGGVAAFGTISAAKLEQTQIAFETMLGSAREARNTLVDLTTFAAQTPFEMPEIEAAARGLVQFGERGDEMLHTLRTLGDAAAGTGSNFGELALIYNQIRGVGKLLTQDFRQLATRGVLSLQDIADHFDVTTAAAQEMMSAGAIGFEDVRQILDKMNDEGGRFANLMEKQSQSLSGLTSTLKDNLGIVSRELAGRYVPIVKSAVKGMVDLTDQFRDAGPAAKSFASLIIGGGAAVGTLLTSAGVATTTLGQLALSFNSITQLAERYTGVQKALNATVAIGKTALIGLAVAGIAAVTDAIIESLTAVRSWNDEIERSRKVVEALLELDERRISKITQALQSPEDPAKAIREAERELADLQKRTETATQKQQEFLRAARAADVVDESFLDEDLKRRGLAITKRLGPILAPIGKFFGFLQPETEQAQRHAAEVERLSDATLEMRKTLDQAKDAQREATEAERNAGASIRRTTSAIREQTVATSELIRRRREAANDDGSVRIGGPPTLSDVPLLSDVFGLDLETGELQGDLKKTFDSLKETVGKGAQQLAEEGRRVAEQFLTPIEKQKAALADLNRLFKAGAITEQTLLRGVLATEKELLDVEQQRNLAKFAGLEAIRRGSREEAELLARAQQLDQESRARGNAEDQLERSKREKEAAEKEEKRAEVQRQFEKQNPVLASIIADNKKQLEEGNKDRKKMLDIARKQSTRKVVQLADADLEG